LFEQKLSENELVKEIGVLDDRIKWAANILQDASVEINRALNGILISNTNVQVNRLLEDIPLDQKK